MSARTFPPWMTTSQDVRTQGARVEFATPKGAAPPAFAIRKIAMQPWSATCRPPSTLPLYAESRCMISIPGPITCLLVVPIARLLGARARARSSDITKRCAASATTTQKTIAPEQCLQRSAQVYRIPQGYSTQWTTLARLRDMAENALAPLPPKTWVSAAEHVG